MVGNHAPAAFGALIDVGGDHRLLRARLETLQELLYAEGRHKLLVVLQAMDTAGKDSTIRYVFQGADPLGVKVASFKAPTPYELARDYLWRVHHHVPGAGEIAIFNRSHYEDVLVTRVNGWIDGAECKRRYRQINDFERMLAETGTTILKFYLHISKDEQKKRLEERRDNPQKQWKFQPGDLAVRAQWGSYMKAYEAALSATSTGHAPWHVVEATDDRYRELTTGRTLLAAARTGHLGPTVFRSTDRGRRWVEASQPPAFKPGSGRTVDHTFWLTPGHASQPGVWYAGTSPQGLFRSDDGGATWAGVDGFNEHPQRKAWCSGDQDGTPDGAKLHSILVDPRDPAHVYIGMSSGGVFESSDAGASWRPLNKGIRADFLPEPAPEYGHDPHCLRFAGGNPDRLYQQNHCGIYRLDRPGEEWIEIGTGMPKSVGSVGFPMVAHPRDADTLWVFPMDGTDVWPRVAPNGKPAA